ncbi:hypothetical protein ACIQW9_01095 [Herminiimonas sp. NPDC097707]|uniref:hypothetical protein n=1 Tax=Herminiimonas sp. NPDC097707 TaxID=3364007 RepID=UPI00383B23FC
MIDIRFEINGRRVDPRNIGDALEGMMLKAVGDSIRKKLANCRCAEHGQFPKLVAKGRTIEKLNFEIFACCEPLLNEASRKLGS